MSVLEVVEKQNIIIQRQSELITRLCEELEQHTSLDKIEAELAEINALKVELNDAV